MRRRDPRGQPGSFERNVDATARLRTLAERRGITLVQLALARLLAQGEDIVAIPGSRRPIHVAENAMSADVELTADDLAEIEAIVPDGAFGARYPEALIPPG